MIKNEKIEWIREYSESIINSVTAFANTKGGTICVGFSDKGEPVGIDNIDDCFVRITNAIRDEIVPDITMFTKYDVE